MARLISVDKKAGRDTIEWYEVVDEIYGIADGAVSGKRQILDSARTPQAELDDDGFVIGKASLWIHRMAKTILNPDPGPHAWTKRRSSRLELHDEIAWQWMHLYCGGIRNEIKFALRIRTDERFADDAIEFYGFPAGVTVSREKLVAAFERYRAKFDRKIA